VFFVEFNFSLNFKQQIFVGFEFISYFHYTLTEYWKCSLL